MTPARLVLVTGGIRSGKSAYAENLLAHHENVTYVATGPNRDDAAWADRVRAHQARRPTSWASRETTDLPSTLAVHDSPLLVDDLGSWLTAALERSGAWHLDGSDPDLEWPVRYGAEADRLIAALAHAASDVVLVTNEVGFGLVSPYASGRVFQDELGRLNTRVAALADRVVLVVSGCPLVVKDVAPSRLEDLS